MSLPFLPGYSTPTDPNKTNFSRSQGLSFRNGVPNYDERKPGIGGSALTTTVAPPKLQKIRPKLPEKLSHLKGLKFEAYFEENVYESNIESNRVRKCQIHFHLEDGTITVLEPKVKNSGIPQGLLLKRQKIPKGEGEGFVDIEDLLIGEEVFCFGKLLKIVDAEAETRKALQFWGLPVSEPLPYPEEQFIQHRKQMEKKPSRDGTKKADPLKQFLEKDRQVLRFYCYWDDRSSPYGDLRKFKLHMFLADDTIEVVEELKQNSGRDPFPTFMKRQKPPKDFADTSELRIGANISIFNRTFVIYDCDAFTKDFMSENYGVTDFTPLPEDPNGKTETAPQRTFSPLIPKPAKKQFQKMLDNDGKILRFSASMVSNKPIDQERIFVVSYYLADDTIGVYEPPQRNTGVVGGKFLERRKITKPNNEEYTSRDFYVGAVIQVFSNGFVLNDADEYAFKFMESNPQDFPYSDLQLITEKLQDLLHERNIPFEEVFTISDEDNGTMSPEEFRSAILSLNFDLVEQEIVTLIRSFSNESGRVNVHSFYNEVKPISK